MKRLLFYNWNPIDSPLGGGVTKYIKNIVPALLDTGDFEIYYLSSGTRYTKDGKQKIEKVNNSFDSRVKTFELVNSVVLAPIMQSVKNLVYYLHDESQADLIRKFITKGRFDIIHVNNLEGLTLASLSLAEEFPDTRFIYSAHNYTAICTRATLWKDADTRGHNCDKKSFEECSHCYRQVSRNIELFSRKYLSWLKGKHLITWGYSEIFPDKVSENVFQEYEVQTIDVLNQFDVNLAVSARVKHILVNHGLREDKTFVSYIGTKVADNALGACNTDIHADPFTIIYMGYMTAEKGYEFFADCIEELAKRKDISKRIRVKIVARNNDNEKAFTEKIRNVEHSYYSVEWVNGYTKDNQRELLSNVNLGIVPVMWEDNLPQVAIEQVALGVPILVSDLGGAQEICNNADFIFEAGNKEQFIEKLIDIYEHRDLLNDFWNTSMKLVTMQEHIQELERFYAE